ncbi:hypothetical protein F4678DRAFT_479975 [Xylaria arbuscula]|nr:hypothetical protein F4678DRAFT_479975 [Xylaria arbuscula]
MLSQEKNLESYPDSVSLDLDQNEMQLDHDNSDQEDIEILRNRYGSPLMLEQSSDISKRQVGQMAPELSHTRESESYLQRLPEKVDKMSAGIENIYKIVRNFKEYENEISTLQEDLKRTKHDLKTTKEQYSEVEKRWKKATSQLSQLQSNESGTHKLVDSDLIAEVGNLRYNIRSFASQYFPGSAPRQPKHPSAENFRKYMVDFTEHNKQHRTLPSEAKGPLVIQSFLWRLLVGEVFENFCWAPRLRRDMTRVYAALRPAYEDGVNRMAPMSLDAGQKFQSWKAATTSLILQSIQNEVGLEGSTDEIDSLIGDIITGVLNLIEPFARESSASDEGAAMEDDLRDIVKAAISLDQQICKQTTPIYWIVTRTHHRVPFNPNHMEQDKAASQPEYYVDVMTAPALVKRQKQTGGSHEIEHILLKMTVT